MVKKLVVTNRGTVADAQDIFQDALSIIYEKSQQENLILRCSFKTYLYGIARNMWLMVLRKQRRGQAMLRDTEAWESQDASFIEVMTQARRKQLFHYHLQQLGKDCQQVLQMFFAGKSMKDIAQAMHFSVAYAKKRKFVCQQKLIKSIEQDGLFRELTEH